MLVKCKSCEQKIEKKTAFKVIINNKNCYYCNENEYLRDVTEKNSKNNSIKISIAIIGNTSNTLLFKEINEIGKIHTFYKLQNYLENNRNELEKIICKKQFSSEFGKIKYITAVIKNSIKDYVIVDENSENINTEILSDYNYKKIYRKTISDYLNEY